MRICITGIGIISALGVGKEANREKLLAGVSCVAPAEILDTVHKEFPVGEVGLTNRQLKLLLQQDVAAPISRNALLGMVAAREAVEDAHLSTDDIRLTDLINGTTVGGMDLSERFAAQWREGDDSQIDLIRQHDAGVTTRTISYYIGGCADSSTVSTACSSALNALIVGANMLRLGARKRVIVGGTEALTKFHLNGFAALGILSHQVCRPFEDDRDGINLGEGAAYLVLETEEEAQRRGAHIYAYLGGYGNRCDAYHQTASSPNGEGAFLAMADALDMAGMQPADIQYINAHGTATPNNDASESVAIDRLFGASACFTSTKALTGHTTSASGSIEAIFCLMYMQERGYRHVMSNAFGFGGNDSSIILSADPIELSTDVVRSQVLRFGPIAPAEEVDYKQYIPAMQARRLSPVMRRLVVAARQALEAAGVECPDAIIVGTQWGGMQPSATLLEHMIVEGEQDMSPALFMQSTHNSPAGTLALHLGCHGYNTTFSHSERSYAEAEADAMLQLMLGNATSVLVCSFDEEAHPWQEYLVRAEIPATTCVSATVLKLR